MHAPEVAVPANLKAARKACGLSLAEAAKAIGETGEWLKAVEEGLQVPGAAQILSLARTFDMSVAGLIKGHAHPSQLNAKFRSTHGAQPQQEASVESIGRKGIVLAQIAVQLATVRRPLAAHPMPDPGTWSEAQRQGSLAARQFRQTLGLGHEPIKDLHEIARRCGGIVAEARLSDGLSGVGIPLPKQGFILAISDQERADRQRFTLAHELGHLLMDQEPVPNVSLIDEDWFTKPPLEMRADAFAGQLLLPNEGIRRHSQTLDKAIEEWNPWELDALAQTYGVSYGAAAYRLRASNFIDEARFDELLKETRRVNGARQKRGQFRAATPNPAHLDSLPISMLRIGYVNGRITQRRLVRYEHELQLPEGTAASIIEESGSP